MVLDSKRSYYAVIPANVRYDESLIPSAKLLYGEITALTNEKGYCWATNDYFSHLYSVSKKTVSTWIKSLSDAGYISLEFVNSDNENKSVIRLIKIAGNFCDPITKTSIPPGRKLPYPHNEKVMENNTMNISLCGIFEKPKIHDESLGTKKIFEVDSDPYLLARFLERNITANNPKFPQGEQQRQRWAKDFDLMLRRDKIEADDIAEIIEWCQKDNFWKSNILSGKKLREKYQQLRMRLESR